MSREAIAKEVEQLEQEVNELLNVDEQVDEEVEEPAQETSNQTDDEETSTEDTSEASDEGNTNEEETPTEAEETPSAEDDTASSEDTSTDWEARYKEVQSFATKTAQQNTMLMEQLQSLSSKPAAEVAEAAENAIDKAKESMDKFKEEYPELAELLMPVLDTVISDKVKPVKEVTDILSQDNTVRVQQDFNNQVQQTVSDAADIIQTDDFSQWMVADTMLPSTVKAQMFTSTVVKDAVALLSQYKFEKQIRDDRVKQGKTHNKNKAVKDAAAVDASPKAKSPKTFMKTQTPDEKTYTNAEIDAMSLEEFAKNEKDIMAALQKGLIF